VWRQRGHPFRTNPVDFFDHDILIVEYQRIRKPENMNSQALKIPIPDSVPFDRFEMGFPVGFNHDQCRGAEVVGDVRADPVLPSKLEPGEPAITK
jgi:hypothetical protein